MAHIKMEMPENKLAIIKIPVRISDINYGNHIGNDAFVSIIHEARIQWLKQNQFSEMNFDGSSLIMGDLVIEFKQEGFYGDEIEVQLFAGEISRVSFELYYQLSTQRNGQKVVLANAKTGMICFNYTIKKTESIPENAKAMLTKKT